MTVKLEDISEVIRSKNAGPYELTLDIIFKSKELYQKAINTEKFNKSMISQLYKIPEDRVLSVIPFEPANAIKITLKRAMVAGDIGETDVYGAQQHAPLLGLEFEF